jgi:uncharacterized protein YqgV (UPF0045/DUF77 family)
MNAAMAIQVVPKTTDTDELLTIVDAVINEIDQSGLSYEVGAFETTVEGDLKALIDLLEHIQNTAVVAGAKQVTNYIKLIYSPTNHILTTEEKLSKYRS